MTASTQNHGPYTKHYANGDIERFNENNQLHCENGPAVESNYGKQWLINGQFHRTDGPAVEAGNSLEFWVEGKLHRIDGPAVMNYQNNGTYTSEWWIEGVQYTEEDFKRVTSPNRESNASPQDRERVQSLKEQILGSKDEHLVNLLQSKEILEKLDRLSKEECFALGFLNRKMES